MLEQASAAARSPLRTAPPPRTPSPCDRHGIAPVTVVWQPPRTATVATAWAWQVFAEKLRDSS